MGIKEKYKKPILPKEPAPLQKISLRRIEKIDLKLKELEELKRLGIKKLNTPLEIPYGYHGYPTRLKRVKRAIRWLKSWKKFIIHSNEVERL